MNTNNMTPKETREKILKEFDEKYDGIFMALNKWAGLQLDDDRGFKPRESMKTFIDHALIEFGKSLVPKAKTAKKENGRVSLRAEENRNGWNACRRSILSQLEEMKSNPSNL